MASEKFEFQNADGETLAGNLELPVGEPRAVAIFAHCFTCSRNVRAASRISRALAERGLAVLRFDFTGLGSSEGDFANTNFSSNVGDVEAAAEALEKHIRAPSLLVGHSLGGSAVLTAAGRLPGVRGVATIGAPSEPRHVKHLFGEQVTEIQDRGEARVQLAGRSFTIKKQFLEDIAEHRLLPALAKLRPAVLIFHSPTDEIVDLDHARRIYEAARHPKSFVALEGADHLLNDPQDAEYVANVLCAWVERYLPMEQPPRPRLAEGEVVVEERDGVFAQYVHTARHTLEADEPRSVGGQDSGPGPYDYLLGALGACTSMTLRMYANRKQWPVGKIRVQLRHERIHAKDCEECESESGFISRIEKQLTVEGDLDDEQRARLLEIADKCPVHRTLTHEKQMVTRYA